MNIDFQLDTIVSSRLSITLAFTALMFLAFFSISTYFSDLTQLSYFMPIFGVLSGFLSLIFNLYISLRAMQLRYQCKRKQILMLNPLRVLVISTLIIVMWIFLAVDHGVGSFFLWFICVSIVHFVIILVVVSIVWFIN